jgi:hypothetical protein
MMVYGVVTVILLVLWLICTVGSLFVGTADGLDKEEWQVVAACSTAGLFFVFLWPLALPVALVVGVCYGLYSIVKVAGRVRRGEL